MHIIYAVTWGGEGGVFVTKEARARYIDDMFEYGAGGRYQMTEMDVDKLPSEIYLVAPLSEWIYEAPAFLVMDATVARLKKDNCTIASDEYIEMHIDRYVLTNGSYRWQSGM